MAAVSPWFFTVRPARWDPGTVPHLFFCIISIMGQIHGTKMYVGAVFSFALCYMPFSGYTAEMTGFLYGDGNTCSPDEVP